MARSVESSDERLALVTGTSRGIGAAVASRLVERGWMVAGVARHAAAIDHARYRHVMFGLVNTAALAGELGPIEAIDADALLRVSAVNWVAPAWLVGFAIRRTRPETALRVVNVSSGSAVHAFAGLSAYCSSKAALRIDRR